MRRAAGRSGLRTPADRPGVVDDARVPATVERSRATEDKCALGVLCRTGVPWLELQSELRFPIETRLVSSRQSNPQEMRCRESLWDLTKRCWSQSVSIFGWECSSEASPNRIRRRSIALAPVVGQVTDFRVVHYQFLCFATGAHRCCGQRGEGLRCDRLGVAQKTRTRSVPTRRRNSGRRRRPS
jgi:hypothetical protein